jgi:hypothetical protein
MDGFSNHRDKSMEHKELDSKLKVDYSAMIAGIMQQRQENEDKETVHIELAEQHEKRASDWAKLVALWEGRNNEEAAKGARESESKELESSQSNRRAAETFREKIDEMTTLIQALILEQERDREGDNEAEEPFLHNSD